MSNKQPDTREPFFAMKVALLIWGALCVVVMGILLAFYISTRDNWLGFAVATICVVAVPPVLWVRYSGRPPGE